ncbi:hypothetical protein LFE_1305 [Leptospirillum ferrooxidans C2-3]|uniref:Uncharacterized protein n=1 Tax=Leptospirillum ferrooxidans (strain C2-3) TaxID=1162668 RepID=I0INY9_LEPFC|nr:hypothetical protein [Leptospirillum ferrooxidans]BAM06988.1 hypothetical protein LFE_1305 [Leptospirillum ferrooxidans C2-3]
MLFLPLHIGIEVLDEAIHRSEHIRFFPIPVMPMIPFSLLVVVTDDSLALPSIEKSIFEPMAPVRIRTIKFSNDYLDNRSIRKDFSVPVKKMRFIHVGYCTNNLKNSHPDVNNRRNAICLS